GGGGGPRYFASGPGLSPQVKVEGSTLTIQGTLPAGLKPGDQLFISAAAQPAASAPAASRVVSQAAKLTSLGSLATDLPKDTKNDGPSPVIYQAFHYLKPPRAVDLTCTVIKTLGDRYDFLAYYSDFRIDNPEAGTSSNGPLGGGPDGGAVTGIGA